MNKNQPINFIAGSFVYPGGKRELFKGEKEYVALPSNQKYKVNNLNIWNTIKEIFIPISLMSANISNRNFLNSIEESDKCGFYDLETNDKEEFVLGYVNDKKFIDPKLMCEELLKFDYICSFNCFKFDNEILHRYCPEYFLEVRNADFSIHTLNGIPTIDLYAIISINVALESYGAEGLAKDKGFDEEIPSHNDEDKDKKCQVDIKINKFLFEKYNILKAFNTISKLANIDISLMQIIKGERLRKWILMNKYLTSGFLPLKTNKANPEKKEMGIIKIAKPGFYENMKYLDISSTYPQTAVNLGNLGMYDDDTTFSKLQEELLELSKDKDIKPYVKSIANSLFGIQYSLNEHWRNDEIFEIVVNIVANKVSDIYKQRKDIVYINTDCFVVPIDSPNIEIEGYIIKKDYEFSELYIYNPNRWVGKTKERIEFRGFKRLNTRSPKILKIARDELLSKLNTKNGKEFKESLDEYEDLVKNTIKKLKKFDSDYFKITIRKRNDYCPDIELMDIWKKFKMGFNQVYYNDKGEFTLEPKEISYKYYESLIKSMAREFSTDKDL